MSDPSANADPMAELSPEEMQGALFANLVMQQVSTALMYLGQLPMPEGQEPVVDLERAQMFIDQLEVLEAKTRGNLTKTEEQLLKQSLTDLRLAFVQVSARAAKSSPPPSAPPPPQPPPAAGPKPESPASGQAGAEDQSKVRFSKKYSS